MAVSEAVLKIIAQDLASGELRYVAESLENVGKRGEKTGDVLRTVRDVVGTVHDAFGTVAMSINAAKIVFDAIVAPINFTINAFKSLVGYVTDSVKSLFDMSYQAFESIDSLDEMAQQIGITAAELQAMSKAAEMSGASTSNLASAMRILENNMNAALDGDAKKVAMFEKMGIAIRDTHGNARDLGVVFKDVAQHISTLGDRASQSAQATEMLGKAGRMLLPMFSEGKAGIDAATASLRSMGVLVDQSAIVKAGAFEKAWVALRDTLGSFSAVIGRDLMPAFTALMERVNVFLTSFKNTTAIKTFTDTVSQMIYNTIHNIPWAEVGRGAAQAANQMILEFKKAGDEFVRMIAKISFTELVQKAKDGIAEVGKALALLRDAYLVVKDAASTFQTGMNVVSDAGLSAFDWLEEKTKGLRSSFSEAMTSLQEETIGFTKGISAEAKVATDSVKTTAAAVEDVGMGMIRTRERGQDVLRTVQDIAGATVETKRVTDDVTQATASLSQSYIKVYENGQWVKKTVDEIQKATAQVKVGTDSVGTSLATAVSNATGLGAVFSGLEKEASSIASTISSWFSNSSGTPKLPTPPAAPATASGSSGDKIVIGGPGGGSINGVTADEMIAKYKAGTIGPEELNDFLDKLQWTKEPWNESGSKSGGKASGAGSSGTGSTRSGTPIDQGTALYDWLMYRGDGWGLAGGSGGTAGSSTFQTSDTYSMLYGGNYVVPFTRSKESSGPTFGPLGGSGMMSGASLGTLTSVAGLGQVRIIGPGGGGSSYTPGASGSTLATGTGRHVTPQPIGQPAPAASGAMAPEGEKVPIVLQIDSQVLGKVLLAKTRTGEWQTHDNGRVSSP